MFERFELTSLDIALLLDIYTELKDSVGEDASDMILSSSFLQICKSDPKFVQCQGTEYWVETIQKEWMDQKPDQVSENARKTKT